MSLLAKLGYRIAGRAVVKLGRRIFRENKIKRDSYIEGYEAAKLGKKNKYK